MKELRITFKKCEQISQAINDEREHMNAKIYFTISERNGSNKEVFSCSVRQPDGGKRAYEREPIEVDSPDKLMGKINYGEFRDVVERYYRMMIGKDGVGISFGSNSSVQMKENRINIGRKVFFIHKAEQGGAW
jgi:hypothetical protein